MPSWRESRRLRRSWSASAPGGGSGFGGSSRTRPIISCVYRRIDAVRWRKSWKRSAGGWRPLPARPSALIPLPPCLGAWAPSASASKSRAMTFTTLEEIANDLVELLKQVEGAREVTSSLEIGRPELRLVVDRAKASAWGLNAYTIAAQVRTAIEGTTATKLRIDGQEYDVLVRLRRDDLPKIDDLYALTVSTPLGAAVPLREVTSFITMQGPVSIRREDQQRVVTVSARVAGTDLGKRIPGISENCQLLPAAPRYSLEIGGEAQEMYRGFWRIIPCPAPGGAFCLHDHGRPV